MIRLLSIIGARPQIIKSAAISRAIQTFFSNDVQEKVLHTGQHYDANMSQIFFDELGIPAPDFNLGVGSGNHGMQTAHIIEGIENILLNERFDGVILYGDTNSTLAGSIAAAKLSIPVFHIEAGLRSYNMAMPEEINRIVCDQLSSILFAPTKTAIENLSAEGLLTSPAVFSNKAKRMVINCGDVMFDNALYFSEMAEKQSRILESCSVQPDGYVLATIHRNFNTDVPDRIRSIFHAISYIADTQDVPVVLPLHPRTRKFLPDRISSRVLIIPPVSFFDILKLERNARLVMTDSGGVQKEAFFFSKPSIIFRPETEWVEIIEHGAGALVDADYNKIVSAYGLFRNKKVFFPPLFGDGHAAEKILGTIKVYLGTVC